MCGQNNVHVYFYFLSKLCSKQGPANLTLNIRLPLILSLWLEQPTMWFGRDMGYKRVNTALSMTCQILPPPPCPDMEK